MVVIATTTTVSTPILLSVSQQEAAVQNTTMANQTILPTENQTMTNQRQGGGITVAATANLTQADFESVIDNLNSASKVLHANDTIEAYDAVNSVENELFEIATDQGEQNMNTLIQIFKPPQDSVDSAGDALKNNDTTL